MRDICAEHEVKILKGHVAKDNVHVFVSIPPQVTISRLLQWLKGKTAHHLMAEFQHTRSNSVDGTCGREGTSAAAAGT
jgi:putative transposase